MLSAIRYIIVLFLLTSNSALAGEAVGKPECPYLPAYFTKFYTSLGVGTVVETHSTNVVIEGSPTLDYRLRFFETFITQRNEKHTLTQDHIDVFEAAMKQAECAAVIIYGSFIAVQSYTPTTLTLAMDRYHTQTYDFSDENVLRVTYDFGTGIIFGPETHPARWTTETRRASAP